MNPSGTCASNRHVWTLLAYQMVPTGSFSRQKCYKKVRTKKGGRRRGNARKGNRGRGARVPRGTEVSCSGNLERAGAAEVG